MKCCNLTEDVLLSKRCAFILHFPDAYIPPVKLFVFAKFHIKRSAFHSVFFRMLSNATRIRTVINDNNCNLSAFYANAVLMFHMLSLKWHAACSYIKPILKSASKHERGSFYSTAITWEHIKAEFTCN